MSDWPAASYGAWSDTCDTLHAYSQVLGKLAVKLAPPEPELQHAALRLTARGWETTPLPAPNGSGSLVVALDLRLHDVVIEHSAGRTERIPLTPDREVGTVTRELLAVIGDIAGAVAINPTPQEVPWTAPLDEDREHARYDRDRVDEYFAAATKAAQILTAFRAPYRGRSTPVNAWWGSFDLAVSLYSGVPADPPSGDFIMRNSMDSQQVAVGWWPGDGRYPKAAFYAYAHPAPPGVEHLTIAPPQAGWNTDFREYLLDWDDVRSSKDPHGMGLEFARSFFRAACAVCEWDPAMAATAEGTPPPIV